MKKVKKKKKDSAGNFVKIHSFFQIYPWFFLSNVHEHVETQMVQGNVQDRHTKYEPKGGNRVASHGCPVAFSRRILKALRLPWQPTTTAARCNYLKNARRSPIPIPPPRHDHPPPPRGLPRCTGRCKSSQAVFCITLANRRCCVRWAIFTLPSSPSWW